MNYIKKNTIDVTPKRLIGLQGMSNTGKTWSCATFPSPLFVNFDGKLPRGRGDLMSLSFCEEEFLKEVIKEDKLQAFPKIGGVLAGAHVFLAWLKKNASTLQDVTLVIDSWTMMQQLLDNVLYATPKQNDKGEEDGYDFWKRKAIFSSNILAALKGLQVDCVVVFHDNRVLNADGIPTGKFEPLMSGSIKNSLPNNFSHWIRQTAEENKSTKEIEYLWQIKPNNDCNCNCPEPHLLAQPKLMKVKAEYNSLLADGPYKIN